MGDNIRGVPCPFVENVFELPTSECSHASDSYLISIISGVREDRSGVFNQTEAEFDALLSEISSNSSGSEDIQGSQEQELDQEIALSESKELLLLAQASITSLFKASIYIQKQAPQDKYIRSVKTEPFTVHYDIAHLQEKYPSLATSQNLLLQRLGKANARRREYFAYRREHHSKIAKTLEAAPFQATEHQMRPANDTDQRDQRNVTPPKQVYDAPRDGSVQTVDQTEATTFIEERQPDLMESVSSAPSVISFATSLGESITGQFPTPPAGALAGLIFLCPYCFKLQQFHRSNTEKYWKKHVIEDLEPYVCTFEDCSMNTYKDQHTWIDHEQLVHRRMWRCASCPASLYQSSTDFRHHITSTHPDRAAIGAQELLLVQNSEISAPYIPSPTCPFCKDDWVDVLGHTETGNDATLAVTIDNYRRHVGEHLLEIALFGLPRYASFAETDSGQGKAGGSLDVMNRSGRASNIDEVSLEFSEEPLPPATGDGAGHPPLEDYPYRPLSSGKFRLLKLYKHRSQGVLPHGIMVEHSGEQYETLIYIWDIREKSAAIALDGSYYKIHDNLEAALQQLSREITGRSKYIFVDALCINQYDFMEQKSQIKMMGEIHKRGNCLRIWLGEGDDETRKAFELLKKLSEVNTFGRFLEDCPQPSIDAWSALCGLLNHRFFKRGWSIYETVFATTAVIHCGTLSIPYQEFASIVFLLSDSQEILYEYFGQTTGASSIPMALQESPATRFVELISTAFRVSDDGETKEPCRTIESLVCASSMFSQLTAPHDTIYSLLGLACDTENSKLYLDYTLPFWEVFQEFVEHSIVSSHSLDIICRPWAPDYEGDISWIPKRNRAAFEYTDEGVSRKGPDSFVGLPPNSNESRVSRIYTASGITVPRFRSYATDSLLLVDGFILDTIVESQVPAMTGNIPYSWASAADWKDLNEPPPHWFWRFLVADRGNDGKKATQGWESACKDVFKLRLEDQSSTIELSTSTDFSRVTADFLRRVSAVIWGRRMASSRQYGFFCLTPHDAHVGDLLCILFGCSVPVVLRKVFARYELIGECYVHGMMEGEALQIQARDGLENVAFELI